MSAVLLATALLSASAQPAQFVPTSDTAMAEVHVRILDAVRVRFDHDQAESAEYANGHVHRVTRTFDGTPQPAHFIDFE